MFLDGKRLTDTPEAPDTSTSPAATLQAVLNVRARFGVSWLSDMTVLDITGPDSIKFLQNRLTNDVEKLAIGQGQVNAALDGKGKIQGVFDLYRYDETAFCALIEKTQADNAITQILKYKIVEQLTIEKQPSISVFAIQGPQALVFLARLLMDSGKAVSLPNADFGLVETQMLDHPVWLIRRSFTGELGFTIVVDSESPQLFWNRLVAEAEDSNGMAVSPQAMDILRVEAGVPRYGRDYDFETLLPETGLERQAVSYSKGCYLGQETVARVKTYGMVQRALVGLLFEPGIEPPQELADCQIEGKSVGEITSVVASPTLNRAIAMAYLGKSERIPGKQLELNIDGHLYEATVTLLPFHDNGTRSAKEWLDEGLKLFTDGYEEEAIRALRKAIGTDDKFVEAYEALGVILSRQEKYDESIGLMETVLKLDPDHVLAHTNLSVFYMKKGNIEKAEEEKALATTAAFRKKMQESGMQFDPLAHAEAEQKKKEAATLERISMFSEALKFNPEDPLGNYGLASCYIELKRFDEAIEPLQKTLKVQPKHSAAYLSLGKAYEGAADTTMAKETYEKGIEIASAKGDLMPLKEMQTRLEALG